jgi:hypothetical protein
MLARVRKVSGQIKRGFSQMCAVDEIHSEASKNTRKTIMKDGRNI